MIDFSVAAHGAQRFDERPQNTSVVQGQTVVLKCVIEDRAGRVQWVKDGFALGTYTGILMVMVMVVVLDMVVVGGGRVTVVVMVIVVVVVAVGEFTVGAT